MSPTRRFALALVVFAVAAPFVPLAVSIAAFAALAGATVADALIARRRPLVRRELADVAVRGRPQPFLLTVAPELSERSRLRQPIASELGLSPEEAAGDLRAVLTPRVRGRFRVPPAVARVRGPLALGAWTHSVGDEREISVFPDLPGARRLAADVRRGRFRDEGRRTRGPLGLGTEFETLRDYSPDDDIRQVNWLATARAGRAISNQYRVERDRDVICLIDCGRLSAAPIGEATRLDVALDVAVAVAAVAEELGDRCGIIAFDSEIRRILRPRRAVTRAIVDLVFDLQPVLRESDYERAFRELTGEKRAFALLLTDLVEPAAARPLLDALPVLARHHSVTVASVVDDDLEACVREAPLDRSGVYRLEVALEVLDAQASVIGRLLHAGCDVAVAPAGRLAPTAVSAYLRAKARARF